MKKLIVLACLLAAPQLAFAHAMLLQATPGAGANVPPLSEIVLRFSEGVEPAFTTVTSTNAAGETVGVGRLETETADQKTLHIGLSTRLPAGDYKVEWHATSVDTHKTSGHFGFSVTP